MFWHAGRAFLVGPVGLVAGFAAAATILVLSQSWLVGLFAAFHAVVVPVPIAFALDRHWRRERRR